MNELAKHPRRLTNPRPFADKPSDDGVLSDARFVADDGVVDEAGSGSNAHILFDMAPGVDGNAISQNASSQDDYVRSDLALLSELGDGPRSKVSPSHAAVSSPDDGKRPDLGALPNQHLTDCFKRPPWNSGVRR